MSIHLIKLAVGCQDLQELAQVQQRHMGEYESVLAVPIHTRNTPRRAKELLDTSGSEGGSMYRVMKSRIQCRQEILGIEAAENEARGKFCLIWLSPVLIKTVAQPFRPFQGWRYLEPAKAPRDIGVYEEGADDEPPPELAADLAAAGLL